MIENLKVWETRAIVLKQQLPVPRAGAVEQNDRGGGAACPRPQILNVTRFILGASYPVISGSTGYLL